MELTMKTDARGAAGRLRCRLIFALTLVWAAGVGTPLRPPAGAQGQTARAEFEPLAPASALPHAPPTASPAGLGEAIVLQPWRATQHAALTDVGDRPQSLVLNRRRDRMAVQLAEAPVYGVIVIER